MKKVVLSLFLAFLVFGISLYAPLVFAQEDDNKSGSSSGSDSNSITDNSGSSDNEIREEFEKEIRREDGSRIKIEREIEIENGEVKIKIKRTIRDADGNEREIEIEIREEDGKRRIKIEGEDEFGVETKLEIKSRFEDNESELEAILSDGNRTKIKVLPDKAAEIALKRLRSRNVSMELEEIIHKNIPMVVYHIEANKTGRFLGIFKFAMKVEGEIDPETGEFLGTSKPWWAFLVAGEDAPDETINEGKTKIKAETFNGTSEIKIKLEFGTDATEQEQIVNEILDRLSDLNISNMLKIEQEDEPIDIREKLEAEAEVEEGFTEVEFELKFIVDSDNREEIINAIGGRLSSLTSEDINSVFSLEVEEKEEDEEGNEIEIEVEIEDGRAKVEIEINEIKNEFTLDTTDRETIISEIMERTNLNKEEIESVIKFEEESEEED